MQYQSFKLEDSILDAQLNRFTGLEHLTLAGSSTTPDIYTNMLAALTSLESIEFEEYYDCDIPNLIEALAPSTSAIRLKTIFLNNIDGGQLDGDDGPEENYGWPRSCTIDHVADLIKVTADRGIELSGSTLEAREELLKRLSEQGLNRV
jgi:hypothetical protein